MKLIGKFLLAIAMISLAITSCKDDPEVTTVSVTGVKLNKTTLTLAPSGTEKLTATVEPEGATEKTVTWASSDNTIATVSEDGTVTAVKAGEATVTVTTKDGGKTATCAVTVSNSHIAVTGVKLNKTTLTLEIGGKETLTATVEPADASDKTISWSSSDNAKVSVSSTGEVEAKAAGTATITVTTTDGNKTATCTVTVNNPPVGNERTLKSATITLFAGSGDAGLINGTGGAAQFNNPLGMCLDGDGNLYVADRGNHAVRKITPGGVVTTVAGNTAPDWQLGINGASDVAISGEWLYVAERTGNRIRRMKYNLGSDPGWPEEIHVFVGNNDMSNDAPARGHANGTGHDARFSMPTSIDVDNNGNLYVTDFYNRLIRKITPEGVVSDYAGILCENCGMGTQPDADMLSYPMGLSVNPVDNNLYIASYNRERIVKITGQDTYDTFVAKLDENGVAHEKTKDISDNEEEMYHDGSATEAEFARPAVIAADQSGYMFLGEHGGPCGRLRFITPTGHTSTIAAGTGEPLARTNALLSRFETSEGAISPTGIAVAPDGKTLYVATGSTNQIWKITLEYNNY